MWRRHQAVGPAVTRNIAPMADTRNCEQCDVVFAPRREHARFCSARCRVAWNRHHASGSPADTGALDWAVIAMRDTTGRLLRADGWDRADGFAVISEAVWWVTMVDATLVRYRPDLYGGLLAGQDPVRRRMTEDTFGGLRFVRNRMGYDADHADFVEPADPGSGPTAPRLAGWAWKSVPEPALPSLTERGREWELTRYRAYQAQLAGHLVGETFTQATAFLRLVAEGNLSRTLQPLLTAADRRGRLGPAGLASKPAPQPGERHGTRRYAGPSRLSGAPPR